MYYSPVTGSRLYRVTGPGELWPTPLLGLGAYFSKGGRYNYSQQPTVYCSEDPLVALAESAFYQFLEWQAKISTHRLNPVAYPLISKHKLWCFSIDPPPIVIDLEHAQAIGFFQHTPHMLLNPGFNPARGLQLPGQHPARDYWGTQDLAREVRDFASAGSPEPRPEGIRAPALRVKRAPGYRARQLALFVPDATVHQPYQDRSSVIAEYDLEIQFLQADSRLPVNNQTVDIDWCMPQFRVGGAGVVAIPAYAQRPNAIDYSPNTWHDLEIQFA